MKVYRVTIEFNTEHSLPDTIREQLVHDMCVQTESLSDGTYEHIAETTKEQVETAKIEDITPEEKECPVFPKSQGW